MDPDGRLLLATQNVVNLFATRQSSPSRITNSYNLFQSDLISHIAFYNQYGKCTLLSSHGNERISKEQRNFESLGSQVFVYFYTLINKYSETPSEEVVFESKCMEGKTDNDGNQFYELSIIINGKKTRLFYYSSIEARNSEQLRKEIGEFFSLFMKGDQNDWKPSEETKIIGDTPYN